MSYINTLIKVFKVFLPDPYFFDQSMPGQDIAKIGNKNVLIILKNGQTSIRKYCKDNDLTILPIDCDYTDDSKYIVDVFFRNPISRYYSALKTLKEGHPTIYDNIPLPHTVDYAYGMNMFGDPHTYPQYWYIFYVYVLCWCSDNLYFRLNDFNSIGNLVGNVHENKKNHIAYRKLSKMEMDLVKKRYYIDIKIYQNLLNKTVSYNDLISYFSSWIDGESDNSVNKRPRWSTYIKKHHPKNFKE